MPIQVKCFNCDRQFLVLSANSEVEPIEMDCKKIDIICPYCDYVNREFLIPIKQKLADVLTPVEYRQGQADLEALQVTFDFYKDHLPDAGDAESMATLGQVLGNTHKLVKFQPPEQRPPGLGYFGIVLEAETDVPVNPDDGIGGLFGGVTMPNKF